MLKKGGKRRAKSLSLFFLSLVIVLCCPVSSKISVKFNAPFSYVSDLGPASVAFTDLNNDGHLDLIVTNYYSNYVSVMINNGEGIFSVPVNYDVGEYPRSTSIGDLNNDNCPDLAVATDGFYKLTSICSHVIMQSHFISCLIKGILHENINGEKYPRRSL